VGWRAAVLVVALIAIGPTVSVLAVLGVFSGGGGGDTARFVIDGTVISVTESGTATINQDGAPEIDYSGPLGCRGRYFSTEDPSGLPLDFRYTDHDAYLLEGGELSHLGAPTRVGRTLRWRSNLLGTRIAVTVDCPLPPEAVPPLKRER
jgi:hypothetical protein